MNDAIKSITKDEAIRLLVILDYHLPLSQAAQSDLDRGIVDKLRATAQHAEGSRWGTHRR